MKMSLSVVMGIIDKVSAPLQGMASESDGYAKKIKKVQLAQADDASASAMILSFQRLQKQLDKNTMEGEEAAETLVKLKKQMAATENPSAALTNKLAKQEAKLATLIDKDQAYESSLKSTSKRLKKSGVDVKNLDSEFERLSKSQNESAKSVDKMSLKYKKLQRAMAPINKISRAIKMPTLQMAKGAGVGGLAIIGTMVGFGAVMSETATQVNELSKAADDIKMPIAQLQALRMQAVGAEAEVEDMDAAIKEMSLRWGEMKSFSSGAMNDYFKNTNNMKAYNDLKNAKDAMEAYQVIIREIAAEKDISKQNFMADEFFGGDSEKLLPVLKGGIENLNKARQALKDTGGAVTEDEAKTTKAYSLALSKLSQIVKSIKLKVLIPVMQKVTVIFTQFADKFKNVKWRTDLIDNVIKTVNGLYNAFLFVIKGVLFIKDNFKGLIATLAILKIAFLVLNAVIMMNPISFMTAAVLAAVVAYGYLIDKFIGFDVILKGVSDAIGWVWDGIKKLINLLPDALIPDSWKTSADAAGNEVDKLNAKLSKIKSKNVTLGVTTNETLSKKQIGRQDRPSLSQNIIPMAKAQPLTNQVIKSQAEVSLTIKSDKPINIDKAKSERGTNLKLNVGNMMMSY
ncbi:MAG: hypothetical protein V5786_02075 [Psychromonas sp.]